MGEYDTALDFRVQLDPLPHSGSAWLTAPTPGEGFGDLVYFVVSNPGQPLRASRHVITTIPREVHERLLEEGITKYDKLWRRLAK